MAPSTSLCGYDASFAAGLIEAAVQVAVEGHAVALISYDHPYPEPLHTVRPIGANFGVALVLTPQATQATFAALEISLAPGVENLTILADAALDAVRTAAPAARCLPLLAALARKTRETVLLEYLVGNHLRIEITPC